MRLNRFRSLIALAVALLLGGCGDDSPTRSADAPKAPSGARREAPMQSRATPVRGRARAPVEVEATRLGETAASLRFKFQTAAEDVDIHVYGTDGVRVANEALSLHRDDLEEGETLTADVAYTTDGAHGNLAVLVQGVFAGSPAVRVVSFSIGDPRPRAGASARFATASGADKVHALPAREKTHGK